jgi:aspartate/methionine/tyrosine aminotransferase
MSRFEAPFIEWAKARPAAQFDLAGSSVSGISIDDLEGAREAVFSRNTEKSYPPLIDAIAARYRVSADRVATTHGATGANFQVFAALLEPGDDVLIERPAYDPLLAVPRLLGANVVRFERRFEDGFELDPDRVASAFTPRTRLIVVTAPHNPSGVAAKRATLEAIGRRAAASGAHVLVDEVYLDASDPAGAPAATLGDTFISTNSLTKSYGLGSLRCGWAISSASLAERIRRARDVIDGTESVVAERVGSLAFAQMPRLSARAASLVAANTEVMREFLMHRRELEAVLPRASTVVFPRLRDVADTSAFVDRLLHDRDTAVVPGRFFEAPGHCRIGLGTSTEVLRGGLAQLAAALDARDHRR